MPLFGYRASKVRSLSLPLAGLLALTLPMAPLPGVASAGTVAKVPDTVGDSVSSLSDVTGVQTSVSVDTVEVSVFTAEYSPEVRGDGAITVELDVNRDGEADFRASARAPYEEVSVIPEGSYSPMKCAAGSSYGKAGSLGRFRVTIPARCLGYPVTVAARATVILPLMNEEAFDEAGSFEKAARRGVLSASLTLKRQAKGKVVALVRVDPAQAARAKGQAVVKLKAGRSWKVLGTVRLASRGGGHIELRKQLLPRGSTLAVFLRGNLVDTARMP